MPALWMIALFQLVVPLLLLGVLAFTRQPGRWLWGMHALAFGMVLSFMWASARWDLSTLYLRHLLPILWLVASVVGYRRIRPEVGNTGNTSEPHLHIHVERGGEPGAILDGESVPMTLDGRFLVRPDILGE